MPHPPRLNLVVIRSADLHRAETFYTALGLVFEKHRHGNGPEHLAAEHDGMVFEVYPATESKATTATRIGFQVADVDQTIAKLESLGVETTQPPTDSPWGRRAVVRDFDGHAVELTALP
ncbi:VOC family protein [Aeoliella sp.]|uniref:VOC family protein n=1 Tax=Aeoliella sp. TaxID=2795800 RepID=UPI003CCBF9FA